MNRLYSEINNRLMKKIFIVIIEVYLKIHNRLLMYLGKTIICDSSLLKVYLKVDNQYREQVISQLSEKVYDGLHPKNIFNLRSEFFAENVTGDDVVIDVACGTGAILSKISSVINKGVGIEYDPSNLLLCKENHRSAAIDFISGDMYNFDYIKLKENISYTIAIFSHILEHVEDVPSLIKNVDADKLLICVPSQESWLDQLKLSLDLSISKDPTHFREYTRGMLCEELDAAGYEPETIGFNSEGEIVCKAVKKSVAC